MNRYVVAGVLADMRAGRRVVFISRDRPAVREAFVAVAFWLDDDERSLRSPGWERCESADRRGSIRFLPVDGPIRGLSADVVVVDVDPKPRQTGEILTLVDMHGEVICL